MPNAARLLTLQRRVALLAAGQAAAELPSILAALESELGSRRILLILPEGVEAERKPASGRGAEAGAAPGLATGLQAVPQTRQQRILRLRSEEILALGRLPADAGLLRLENGAALPQGSNLREALAARGLAGLWLAPLAEMPTGEEPQPLAGFLALEAADTPGQHLLMAVRGPLLCEFALFLGAALRGAFGGASNRVQDGARFGGQAGVVPAVLEALPDPVIAFDAAGRLMLANGAASRAFAALAGALEPGTPLPRLLEAFAARFPTRQRTEGAIPPWSAAWIARSLGGQSVDEIELADGRWLRRLCISGGDGTLVLVLLDVSDRHAQMRDLEQANRILGEEAATRADLQAHLTSIMESTRIGTWQLDIPRRIITASPQWLKLIGIESEGVQQMPHADFVERLHPDDRDRMVAEEELGPDTGTPNFENEFRMRHENGDWVWTHSRGHVSRRDAEGNPLLITGVDLDITEERRLKEQLHRSEELMLLAMENSVAAIAIFDPEDRLLYRNAEAARMLKVEIGLVYGRQKGAGWRLETLEGEPMPPETRPNHLVREAGGTVRELVFAVRWQDGTRRVMTCNATLLPGEEGQRNTVISFWDITEQRLAMETLERALAQAEEVSRTKSAFLAMMSHEIRTPLNGIMGLAEVLGFRLSDPEDQEMAQTIHRSGEELLAILNAILDLSRLEAGKMQLERQRFDLAAVLGDLETVYHRMAGLKGIGFGIDYGAGAAVSQLRHRSGDRLRLRQVLGNLIDNAIKFTLEGEVNLRVEAQSGAGLRFILTDTGIGMTEEQAARAFEPFEQAEVGLARRFGGTGLGLAIVRELVGLMGGRIELESRPGQGTRVVLELPLADLGPDLGPDPGNGG